MNYWHMNLHRTGERLTDDVIREIVLSRAIGMGIWKRGNVIDPQVADFQNRMKIGDVVAILNGRNPIALVEVASDWNEIYNSNSIAWFTLRRAINIICIKGDCEYIANLPQFPMRTKTLTISITKSTNTYKYIDDWHNHCKINNKYN